MSPSVLVIDVEDLDVVGGGECTDLFDHGQHPWFRIIISVGANAQIDLLVRRVLAVRRHQAEQGVFRCLRDDIFREDGDWTGRTHDVVG